MSLFPDGICALCSQVFAREQLHAHIDSEHPRVRRNTIVVIQAYYPGWLEDHGACEPCWKSYRDAGRILDMLKSARPQSFSAWPIEVEPRVKIGQSGQTGHQRLSERFTMTTPAKT